ncbi:PREDICTED: F-box/kelch-repeat protein At1g64840-like, partial [Camelina sativa]
MAEPETKKKTSTPSSIMSDWSQLPEELLYLISTHLEEENCFDVVHARSVCTSWRSAFPFPSSLLWPSYSLPSFGKFPLESKDLCTLQKIPLFLFRVKTPLDSDAAEYFLGGIGRDESEENHMELLPSLLQCSVKVKIPGSDPTLLNMLDCQIIPLGHQYRMIGWNLSSMAILPLNKEDKRGQFVVLLNTSRYLLVLTSVEMRWKRLEGVPTSYCTGLITFKGRFYANFLSKQIVVIDPYSLEVTLLFPSPQEIAPYLVLSGNDELFLVEVRFPPFGVSDISRFTCRVCRLDEEAGTWAEVNDLGDCVFFICQLGNVSISAKELPY